MIWNGFSPSIEVNTITINCAEDNVRVDVFLADNIPEMTRSGIQRIIEAGGVTVSGKTIKKNHRSSSGEVYEVVLPEPEDTEVMAQAIPLDIVYEDDDLIVVNKTRGMVVHPAPGHSDGTLVNALLAHCGDSLSGIGGKRRPGIVHRLDKDTSGLIVAAKNDFSHLALSAQLSTRTMSRVYETVVFGRVRNDAGIVDAPIGRHHSDRKRQAVTDKNSRNAVTHYEVIARHNGYTHLRCRLETGRTHQIRVHMTHIGHPVLGDVVYGARKSNFGLSGQCLHAREIKFVHPRTQEEMTFGTELPEYFAEIVRKLGKNEGE